MFLQVFIDGACRGNPGPSSVGVCILDAKGVTKKEYYRCIGHETNNVAEYTALKEALRLAAELGATQLKIHSDSQLLVRQVTGEYRVKNQRLQQLLIEIRQLWSKFSAVEIVHVPRELNKRADKLANIALDTASSSDTEKPDGGGAAQGPLELFS